MMLSAPSGLNHVAYPTWNSRATHDFYTRILGCRFVAAIRNEAVPSSGARQPHLHTFFALSSGGCIAFFEVEGLPKPIDDGVPSWIRHLALNVADTDELDRWHSRLVDLGIEVVGPVNHDGLWKSLYFFDPNNIRLELTVQTRPLNADDEAKGKRLLTEWNTQQGHDALAESPA